MQYAELYESFEPKVKEFAKYQGFIKKTQAQAGKFAKKVVEKLIKKHTDASLTVVEDLLPMLMDVEEALADLDIQSSTIKDEREEHQFNLDVLSLELTIEQITKKEFTASSKETKVAITEIDDKLEALEEELLNFRTTMDQWTELGTAAGVLE